MNCCIILSNRKIYTLHLDILEKLLCYFLVVQNGEHFQNYTLIQELLIMDE